MVLQGDEAAAESLPAGNGRLVGGDRAQCCRLSKTVSLLDQHWEGPLTRTRQCVRALSSQENQQMCLFITELRPR